jgi:hypothetical protein
VLTRYHFVNIEDLAIKIERNRTGVGRRIDRQQLAHILFSIGID